MIDIKYYNIMKDSLLGEITFRLSYDNNSKCVDVLITDPDDKEFINKLKTHYIPLFKDIENHYHFWKYSKCAICGMKLHFEPALFRTLSKYDIMCCICRDIIDNKIINIFCSEKYEYDLEIKWRFQKQVLECLKCEENCDWRKAITDSIINLFKKGYIEGKFVSEGYFISILLKEIRYCAIGIKECWNDYQIDSKNEKFKDRLDEILLMYSTHILKTLFSEIMNLFRIIKLFK